MIKFNSSPEPTIGVEIEIQLVDKNNLDLNFYCQLIVVLSQPL